MLDSCGGGNPTAGLYLHNMSVNLITRETSLYRIHGKNFAAGLYSSNQWKLKSLLLVWAVQFC